MQQTRGFILGLLVSILVLFSALGGAVADRVFVIRPLDALIQRTGTISLPQQNTQVPAPVDPSVFAAREETIINVIDQAQPGVVTVAIKKNIVPQNANLFDPFQFFGWRLPAPQEPQEPQTIQQDIGTGFVVDSTEGFVVTNRHVVSDTTAEYRIIDSNGEEYAVMDIYRDPVNDLAILRVDTDLPALALADSDEIRTGQTAIAIGTPLGEFRQTVTLGIVSGLGRGINAGDGFQSERIDNLIQTDAAINPGNSGGPLLNSRGEVMGVNVAVARAENIGFAIPINVVKQSLQNFSETGEFNRPLLGVQYKMLTQETALLNDVPVGAYVTNVVANSTAAQIGLQPGDIIISIDGQRLADISGGLAGSINTKRVGDQLTMQVWRDGETLTQEGTLQSATSQ